MAGAEPITLLQFLPTFKVGGTERHVTTLAAGLDRSRFDLHLGCNWRLGEFLGDIEARGIPVTEYPIRRLYGPHTVRQQMRLARHLRQNRIQIVHSYGFYANCFAIPAARLARIPVVVASIRDTGAFLTERQRRAQRVVCRLANVVLVNAEAVRQWLIGEGYDPGKILVIRNGIDLTPFGRPRTGAGMRQELGIPADAPVIAMVGRINRLKGIEYFLEAAASVAARFSDARFLVVGHGFILKDGREVLSGYQSELDGHIRRLGLQDRVTFTGTRADVPELLSDVAVSVLPSLSEGLPNAVLESMAAAAPVVATRVGGIPEAVDDGVTGLLVPPRDSAALADAILRILQDRDWATRLGRAGRRRVVESFSLEKMVRETERLYVRLLGEAADGRAPSHFGRVATQQVRRRIKSATASVLSSTGGDRLLGMLAGSPGRLLVLGYHRVVEHFEAAAGTCIPPMLVSRRMLEAHLDWVGRRYRVISLDDLRTHLVSGEPFDQPVAVVTFDDGYADVYEHGFPLLQRKGIPAAVFVVTDLVGTSRVQIYDTLYLLLARALRSQRFSPLGLLRELTALGVRLPIDAGAHVSNDPFTMMRFFLTTLSGSDLACLSETLEARGPLDETDLAPLRSLSWDQVTAMHRAGVVIGSHTRRHALLTSETDDDVRDELVGSRRHLMAELGGPVRHFSYPDGRFNPTTVRAVAAAGYQLAVTTCSHRDPKHPVLTVPRRILWEHSIVDATLRFSPAIMRCYTSGAFDLTGRCALDHGGSLLASPTGVTSPS